MSGAPASNEKIDDDRELPLIRSSAIPESFAHGFSTRAGGVSAPPFDSLNLGGKWGDTAAAVETVP
jgi:copper oxidase (laccase) domain-containing protein